MGASANEQSVVYFSRSLTLCTSSSLRRIVFTSTLIAILNVYEGPATVSETAWNDGPVIECEKNGESTHPMLMYAASKVVAEKGVSGGDTLTGLRIN